MRAAAETDDAVVPVAVGRGSDCRRAFHIAAAPAKPLRSTRGAGDPLFESMRRPKRWDPFRNRCSLWLWQATRGDDPSLTAPAPYVRYHVLVVEFC